MPLVDNVNARRDAIVPLAISGPAGEARVDAIVDTGFSGFLLLPSVLIVQLALPRLGTTSTTLADGTQRPMHVYTVAVSWLDEIRTGPALAGPTGEVLLGTTLLANSRLTVDYPEQMLTIT